MTMWVFGYGSLLWNPGFAPVESVAADLTGFSRSFCMLSIHHRGTVDRPGLVLALDEADAMCTGVAFRVAQAEEGAVLAQLRERELISSAYVEKHVPLALQDGRAVEALAYVGGRGPNPEYLYNTAAHLSEMGIDDPDMAWLVARVRDLT